MLAALFWIPSTVLFTPVPAADVTLDRPCEAFEVTLLAASFDFAVAVEAASVAEA